MDSYRHFDGPSSYAAWFDKAWNNTPQDQRWQGLFSSEGDVIQGLNQLQHGDESHVEQAKALMDRFEQQIEISHQVWHYRVAGHIPDIGRYLAGDPLCMRIREPELSDRTPLRVWVGVTSSGMLPESTLVNRGVTLAAFAMAMLQYRPVIISPYVNLGNSRHTQNALISWDVSTSPLILSELMASLAAPKVVRHLGISACHLLNPGVTGQWHRDYADEPAMRRHLNAAPDDLWLPSIHAYDELVAHPIQWITTQVAKFTDPDREDY